MVSERRERALSIIKMREVEAQQRGAWGSIPPLESIDNFHPWMGTDVHIITDEDMDKLKSGEPLWFSDGEYSHIIIYRKKEDITPW